MKQKILTFLMLALLSTTLASAAYLVDGIYYTVRNNEAEVSSLENGAQNPSGDIVIPESITVYDRTYPVTSIGIQAFYDDKITSVDIPVTVTKIDFGAFSGCSSLERVNIHDFTAWCNINFVNTWSNPLLRAKHLYLDGEELTEAVVPNSITRLNNFVFTGWSALKSISIPNTVTAIGVEAFAYCENLTDIEIPAMVDTIGSSAFTWCKSITSLTLPEHITTIGSSAFSSCQSLTHMVIPDEVTTIGSYAFAYCYALEGIDFPDGLTSIGEKAFLECSLNSIELPNSLVNVGSNAFSYNNKPQSLHIPASLVSIGKDAFTFCSGLQTITVDSDNPNYDSRGNCNALIETSSNILLRGSSNTTIPSTVTVINDYAFYRCGGLTSIEIPSSVVTLGNGAFYYCQNLTQINIPNSVTSIGREAFDYCTALSCGIDIPNSVTLIGENAFRGCSKMPYVNIGSGVDSIGQSAFYYCYGLESITVSPDNPYYDSRDNCNAIIHTGRNALVSGCNNTVIPNSVVFIPNHIFYGMRKMKAVHIPSSVNTISRFAFYNCGMKRLTFDEGVTTIGEWGFYVCDSITSVVLPNSLVNVDERAFEGCNNLQEATIGNGQTFVPERMFSSCGKMVKLTIGSAVDTIASQAFRYCGRLADVTCLALTPPKVANDAFHNYNATLSVPLATVEAYRATYPWSEFADIVGILIGGDLNGDGTLNVTDLTVLIGLLLDDAELPSCADVNGDGVVNVTDLTLLINKMLDDPN